MSNTETQERIRRKTIFLDIDGTLVIHKKNLCRMITEPLEVIYGVHEKFLEWRAKDYYIILTTARPEGVRSSLERQLNEAGIFYDKLVMGLPVGPRVLVNDKKPDGTITAYAYSIERDSGIAGVEV